MPQSRSLARALLAPLLLCLAVVWGAWIRVETALGDPSFDARHPEGMLRSDPALLYYITERILDAGGGVPADFRADPRVQHPDVTDIPAEFAVGQEFLVAWAHLLTRSDEPLHVTALRVMALTAALLVVGVFTAVRAVTGSDRWAALAALLALVTPANYRTIGFVLVREDLSLPLFALHLGWLARAMRTGKPRDFLGTGLLLAAALSTWHALGFLVLLELAVLWVGFLWTGRSPFDTRAATSVLFFPALAGLVVPALRASGWLYSPAAALALGLWACAFVRRVRGLSALRVRALALGASALWFLATRPLAPAAYAHVHQVLWAKLRLLGQLPADPQQLSFDARLLWQGPFETLAPSELSAWMGWPVVLLLVTAVVTAARLRGKLGGFGCLALGLALAAVPVAWLFGRLAVLLGLFVPIAGAIALERWKRPRVAQGALAALCLVQGFVDVRPLELSSFLSFLREHRLTWYLPGEARDELAALVKWVEANVPADQAIAADLVNSTAILAHTRRAIVLQPKYETDKSRRQAEAFLTALFHGTSAEMAVLLRERFRCRYVLFDRYALWDLSRYTAGLRLDEPAPRPGTAAEVFLGSDPAVLENVAGFELLYRSPPGGRWADYRLYRLR